MEKMCLEPCFVKFSCLREYPVYIDGSNVAYSSFNQWKKPLLSNIINLIGYLVKELKFAKESIFCICDPTLKYKIDKPTEYKILIKEGLIIEAPKVADEFILSFALKREFCFIISNDRFRDYLDQLPSKQWLEERRVSFMIINDDVCLSPNISYEKIDVLPLNEEESNQEEQLDSKITTLDIINRIETKKGSLDLF